MLSDPVILDDQVACHCGGLLVEDVAFFEGCRGAARQWRCRNGHSVTRRLRDDTPPLTGAMRQCDTCGGSLAKADVALHRVRHPRCETEHEMIRKRKARRAEKITRQQALLGKGKGGGKRTMGATRKLGHDVMMVGAFRRESARQNRG